MAANLAPIFSKVGKIGQQGTILTANTTKDGSSGTIYTVFTAGTEGAFLQKLKIRPKGTNVATVMRIFINNGGANTTAANNSLYDEVGLVASTNIETAALLGVEYPMNIALPPNYTVFVTLGTAVAGGYSVTAVGGDY